MIRQPPTTLHRSPFTVHRSPTTNHLFDDFPLMNHLHRARDLVRGIEHDRPILYEMLQERENVAPEHLTGMERHAARQIHRSHDRDVARMYRFAEFRELAIAARLHREIDDHRT